MRNTLIYDGDCGICAVLAGFAGRRLRPDAEIRASQELDLPAYGLTAAECEETLRYVAADGRRYAAQDAVARLLLVSRPVWRPAGLVLLLPGANALAGLAYRWVSRNRFRLPGASGTCAVPAPPPRARRGDPQPLP